MLKPATQTNCDAQAPAGLPETANSTLASFAEFARRASSGGRLTVAFMGGSLTWGARASDPQRTSYRARICRQFEVAYPNTHFRFIDAAIGGTGAQLGAFRLQRDVLAHEPDLVFLDFTLNDDVYVTTPDSLAAYESILRRLILAGCPVVQMLLASRDYVVETELAKMTRRTAHLALAEAYQTAVGDAIVLMGNKWRRGELDLDTVWPPQTFDNCHPSDAGYAIYAQAAWSAYETAVAKRAVCRLPTRMLHADTYMRPARVRLSTLGPLPAGWSVTHPRTDAMAHDFYMPRWLDNVCVAANFIQLNRHSTAPTPAPAPLRLMFRASSVLLFGESTPMSGKYRVTLDGRESIFDACQLGRQGNGRLWSMVAEGLDANRDHAIELALLPDASHTPCELRLESICVAGGDARVWRD